MSSFQFSSSASSSDPIQTPENNISNAISAVASGLAQQMLGWAQGAYSKAAGLTDNAVQNFFQTSQNMLKLSGAITDQYKNSFMPENEQLIQDANSYNSAARQKVDMGQAGATQAQAGDAARKNAEAQLQSYGINPADGRYAALDRASRVQDAANIAGAENQQRNVDTQIGQNLRTQAVQVGAQMPAAIANINNTSTQASAAAANAGDALANTGRNLMSLPNDYLRTAQNILPPFNAQRSSSMGSGSSSSPDRSGSGSGSGGGGGGGSPYGSQGPITPSGPAWMPDHSGAGSQGFTSPNFGGAGSKIINVGGVGGGGGGGGGGFDEDWQGAIDPYLNSTGGTDWNQWTDGGDVYQPEDGGYMGIGQPTDSGFQDYGNPFDNGGFGQTWDQGGPDNTFGNMSGGTDTEWGNISYDPSANQGYTDYSDWGDYSQPVDTNSSGGSVWDSGDSGGYQDYGSYGGGFDDGSSDYSYADLGGGGDYSYAAGGPVSGRLNRQGGGHVPPQASPSMGARVDDVPANLNAGEFVIPRDVALWKGQEFFQKLIDQARARNSQATAKPTPGGPQPQPQPRAA